MEKFPSSPVIHRSAPLRAGLWLCLPALACGAEVPSTGFTVDNGNRNQVLALWHRVYQASEGYEKRIGWTGNYQGNPGKTSREFADDVERRVNYFRAMCGLPSDVRVNTDSKVLVEPGDAHKPPATTLKREAAQASALLLIRNYNPKTGSDPAITHDPPQSLTGWSAAAWNGNARGNIAFGTYGPGAITEYVVEELASGTATSSWNSLVGHRRWTLFPPATDFATGDQPGTSAERPPTNSLYITQHEAELKTNLSPGFVAYPPAGYFPAPLNSRFWSLSREGADFDAAQVKVTDSAGKPVLVTNVQSNSNFGDPALIWEVGGAAAAKSVYADRSFKVSVTGIGGDNIPTSLSYTVRLIHPDRLTSNQSLNGPPTAPPHKIAEAHNHSIFYTLSPPPEAEALQVASFRKRSSSWSEGAEKKPRARVIDRTSDSYELRTSMADYPAFGALSGKRAFRLTFPVSYDLLVRGVPEQSFEIDRLLLPKSNAKLRFLYRRGYMTKGSMLSVECSANGGVTWKRLGKPIKGVSNNQFDNKISTAVMDLPKSKAPIRIRFRFHTSPSAPIYTHEATPTQPTGIFIDDITTSHCDWLELRKLNPLAAAATGFYFNASTAGAPLVKGDKWCLALRTRLGGKWFPYGPLKNVTVK